MCCHTVRPCSKAARQGVRRLDMRLNLSRRKQIYTITLLLVTPYLLVIFEPELIDPALQYIYTNSRKSYFKIVLLFTMTILIYEATIPNPASRRLIAVTRWSYVLVFAISVAYILLRNPISIKFPMLGICATAIVLELSRTVASRSKSENC